MKECLNRLTGEKLAIKLRADDMDEIGRQGMYNELRILQILDKDRWDEVSYPLSLKVRIVSTLYQPIFAESSCHNVAMCNMYLVVLTAQKISPPLCCMAYTQMIYHGVLNDCGHLWYLLPLDFQVDYNPSYDTIYSLCIQERILIC